MTSPSPSSDFFLLAFFSRSSLRLNQDSAGLILQAVLGGSTNEFRVAHQSGWMFRFSVASKKVGIFVHRLGKFVCKQYAIFFTLW